MHLLDKFRYCPACGSPHFHPNDERSKRCESCGFTYYLNASAATVAVILNKRGELLVTRRALEPAQGTLDLPGGFVDPGESITDGLVREVAEETHLQVQSFRFLFSLPNVYRYSGFNVHTADSFFECEITDEHAISACDDASELFWIPLHRIRPEDFGLESIRNGIRLLLKTL